MKHIKLTEPQIAASGFTDLFVVTAADFTESTVNTDQAIVLDHVNQGDVIRNHTMIQIMKAFNQPAADTAVGLSVGRTGAGYVDCIAALMILVDSGGAAAAGYAEAAAEGIADQVVAADDTDLVCLVDITDADVALTAVTTGEAWIWMDISRASERQVLGAA